jgi:hypothetical protein
MEKNIELFGPICSSDKISLPISTNLKSIDFFVKNFRLEFRRKDDEIIKKIE